MGAVCETVCIYHCWDINPSLLQWRQGVAYVQPGEDCPSGPDLNAGGTDPVCISSPDVRFAAKYEYGNCCAPSGIGGFGNISRWCGIGNLCEDGCVLQCDCDGTGELGRGFVGSIYDRDNPPRPLTCDEWWQGDRYNDCQRSIREKYSRNKWRFGFNYCDEYWCAKETEYGACCSPDGDECTLLGRLTCEDPIVQCPPGSPLQSILPWGGEYGLPSTSRGCRCDPYGYPSKFECGEDERFRWNACVGDYINNVWEGCNISACCLEDCCEMLPLAECLRRDGSYQRGKTCQDLPCTHRPVTYDKCLRVLTDAVKSIDGTWYPVTVVPIQIDDSEDGCPCEKYAPDVVLQKFNPLIPGFYAELCGIVNINFDPFPIGIINEPALQHICAVIMHDADGLVSSARLSCIYNDLTRCNACAPN